MINFNLTSSQNYKLVQEQINGLIQAHLPPGSFTETVEEYVPGKLNFSLFIDKASDVLMSHGAADKNYHWKSNDEGVRFNHCRERKHLLVPGNFLVKRIVKSKRLDFDASQVHSVGWPRLDRLLAMREEQKDSLAALKKSRKRKTVLWAPTHDFSKKGEAKVTLSSYPAFQPYYDKLGEHFETTVSLHPRNRKDKAPTDQLLLESDVVVSDFGTMVYEAWALGKQVIFPSWLMRDKMLEYGNKSAESVIFRDLIGLHATSFDNMCELINTDIKNDERSQKFIDEYLDPAYFGCSGKRVANLLVELAEKHAAQA
jgi:CDP-glycerol glycerophosphotransferase (TagB/SpsB family)